MVARSKTSAHRTSIHVCPSKPEAKVGQRRGKEWEKKRGVGSCGVLWEEGVGIKKGERKTKPCKVWDEWRHQEAAKLLPAAGLLCRYWEMPQARLCRCGRGQRRLPSPDLPSGLAGSSTGQGLKGPKPRGRVAASVWPQWVQPGEGQGASLRPRYSLPDKYTKLLGCSSAVVKILLTDTRTVWSIFRFVQENQLQQIAQKAIPDSVFLQALFIWGSQSALQIWTRLSFTTNPREAKIMITIPICKMGNFSTKEENVAADQAQQVEDKTEQSCLAGACTDRQKTLPSALVWLRIAIPNKGVVLKKTKEEKTCSSSSVRNLSSFRAPLGYTLNIELAATLSRMQIGKWGKNK